MKLEGSVALVTGGAVRIGRAIVEALAARGCEVAIHCNRSAGEARQLADTLKAGGGKAWVIREDLAKPGAAERIVEKACDQAGRLDVLVNNASVFHKDSLAVLTERKILDDLTVNLAAPILLTRAFAAQVSVGRGRRGAVVNLLDRRIASNESDCIPYLLSKKALADFTRTAALALAPRITVNGVAPGAILPPSIGGKVRRGRATARELAGPVPLEGPCTPEDVAKAVVFLLESETVTGQILFVDGGQHVLGTSCFQS